MTQRRPTIATSTRARRVSPLMRTAFHEAGHAVLNSAINDMPALVSIRARGVQLGRTEQRMFARPSSLAQVYLAGFAAEHLLTGRRSRHLGEEVGFGILAQSYPAVHDALTEDGLRDGHAAVIQLLRMGVKADDDAIKLEVERFYDITRKSLAAVWPAVEAVARELLEHEELSREALEELIGPFAIYVPVVEVQRAQGLLLGLRSKEGHT